MMPAVEVWRVLSAVARADRAISHHGVYIQCYASSLNLWASFGVLADHP